jgi:hypothetical protein
MARLKDWFTTLVRKASRLKTPEIGAPGTTSSLVSEPYLKFAGPRHMARISRAGAERL